MAVAERDPQARPAAIDLRTHGAWMRLCAAMALAALVLGGPPSQAAGLTPGPPSDGFKAGWARYNPGDPSTALATWHTSARDGDPWAQYAIGLLHDPLSAFARSGDAVRAARWYLKAADQGLPHAQDRLARLYAHGVGAVAADPARAVLLWQRAALAGHGAAVDRLLAFKVAQASAPEPGLNVATSPSPRTASVADLRAAVEAAEYFDRADRPAGRDKVRADSWRQLAAELGDADTRRRLRAHPSSPLGDAAQHMARTTPPRRAAEPAAPQARAAETGGGERAYILQLGSLRSPADAGRERERMRALFRKELAGREIEINVHGQHHRLHTRTPITLSEAADICRKIRQAGQACLIFKRY